MLFSDIKLINKNFSSSNITTFLSPFDNLIWCRDRARDAFSFEYKSQMFLPKTSRKNGYYVMPILHNGNLIGRMDAKVFRKEKVFCINFIKIEKFDLISVSFVDEIISLINEFMLFNDCSTVIIKKCNHEILFKAINNTISK